MRNSFNIELPFISCICLFSEYVSYCRGYCLLRITAGSFCSVRNFMVNSGWYDVEVMQYSYGRLCEGWEHGGNKQNGELL